jgi:copper resistance protein D
MCYGDVVPRKHWKQVEGCGVFFYLAHRITLFGQSASKVPKFMQQLVDLFQYFSVLSRAGTLILQSLLLGGVLFLSWIASPAPDLPEGSIRAVRHSCLQLLRASAIGLAIVQGISLYMDSVVLMTAAEIRFREVIGTNFFVAGTCMLIAATVTFFIANAAANKTSLWLPLFVAIILSASVMTDHAVARLSGRSLLFALTFLHKAATGFWIGGLPFLIFALFRAKDRLTQLHIASRFSRSAVISVGVLLASGLAMSVIYIGSLGAVFGTAYGVMVVAKVVMLGALLLLGGINFRLLRNSTTGFGMPILRRSVEAELGIGLTVLLTAASLTSQPPGVDLVNDTVTSHMILARMMPAWPRLTYPALIPVSAQGIPLDKTSLQPSGARDVDGNFLSYKRLNDIKESEANHHWMGLIVLAMGVLALLAKAGVAKWSQSWPLLLIGVSILILLRADTESWPFGPQGFWASWLHPEVFQHRLAALACAGFAVFELRVRKRALENDSLALVFPMMCALGGAVLLTHSHSIINVKEQMLTELSHVPLGVLAVFAGWSRWLELRLSATNRKIPSWTWPVCFVLIAVNLLNYREM